MNDDLARCLRETLDNLSEFKETHTVDTTATEEELDLIESATHSLAEASEIVQSLDEMRVEGRKRSNIHLELKRQSGELRSASQLMEKYETEESGDTEMLTSYDTVTYKIGWIEEFL